MEYVLSYVHYISLHIYIETYRKEQIYSKEENSVSCGKQWLQLDIIILDELSHVRKTEIVFSCMWPLV